MKNYSGAFWNYEGFINFKLLLHGKTVNPNYSSELLQFMYKVFAESYLALMNLKRVILQTDNAYPLTPKITWIKYRSWMALK